ncbi:hypothetical protein [Pedobacter sp. SYSU D00535]|uniref:hypothetical protein n=1 Tax=Pedobacter sp. SYSU D00535 TaxID=2810308 RepID=UPI001A973A3A|nr:hypothetical protein [Pedobacter sp. SYSU D00535]
MKSLTFLSISTTVLICVSMSFAAFCQSTEVNAEKDRYIQFETGFLADSYNSIGVRTFFEYQKNSSAKRRFGISYDHSRHLGAWGLHREVDIPTNLSMLSFNYYFVKPLVKQQLQLETGIGAGAVHAYWDNHNNYFGAALNVSISLDVRMGDRLYLRFSPLLVTNRAYFGLVNNEEKKSVNVFTGLPLGLKFKL